jgi:hypothetical protein
MKKDKEYKRPAPKELIPTELGSAQFASISGRPGDQEYMVENTKSRKGSNDGTGNSKQTDSIRRK